MFRTLLTSKQTKRQTDHLIRDKGQNADKVPKQKKKETRKVIMKGVEPINFVYVISYKTTYEFSPGYSKDLKRETGQERRNHEKNI